MPMDVLELSRLLDDSAPASPLVRTWGLNDAAVARQSLLDLARGGVPLDLLAALTGQLDRQLALVQDPARTLRQLTAFILASRSPLSLTSLIERDPTTLPLLLQVIGTSPRWAELLIRDPEAFDLLRMTDGQPSPREILFGEVLREVASLGDERAVQSTLRRIYQRETFRIGYGELFRHVRVEIAMQQLTYLAEAILEAALEAARARIADAAERSTLAGIRLSVIALGRLGAEATDYTSPLQLFFIGDHAPGDEDRRGSPTELVERVAKHMLRLLTEKTDDGPAYEIRTDVRPEGDRGPLVARFDQALGYFDNRGRTWEREAMLAARPVAGDRRLGNELVSQLQPWIYRRYLSRADETGIKALKRRLQQDAKAVDPRHDDPLTGRGGVQEIAAVVRFLQLLSGGDHEEIRGGNTLRAIAGLERGELITVEERSTLEQGYELFRKLEHRRQILGRKEEFTPEQHERRQRQAETIDRLLQSAFTDEPVAAPETDLVLDPCPTTEQVNAVLRPYGFHDTAEAYEQLRGLSAERIAFLSTRRCRFFLSQIAPHLLRAVARTPDPDFTLGSLARVSDSLGGKGILWELFEFHPPSLELYVRLCGASPYLSELLTTSPGMIDELLDSLMLGRLPNLAELEATATELVRAVENPQPLLAAFKNSQHLRIGVRQLLGKEDVSAVHRALADTAEACIRLITRAEFAKLEERFGTPTLETGDPCEFVVVSLGKLGGREPNYHSALDLAFVYEAEGTTKQPARSRKSTTTTNSHFFQQLAQRILKVLTELGPQGRLYEVQTHLRTQGNIGPLAVSLAEVRRHLLEDPIPPVDRLTLTKARPLYGSSPATAAVQNAIADGLVSVPWQPEFGEELRRERMALEETATGRNLKRAAGGTIDIECVIQSLQWRNAGAPGLVGIGTLAAIDRLRESGRLSAADAEYWDRAYRFLRQVESALRLMNGSARHDLPDSGVAWQRLAMLLRHPAPHELAETCRQFMAGNRERFERFFTAV